MSNSNKVYQAGIARNDITPPVGIRLFGYAVREGLSKAVEEPLTLTALAIGDGTTTTVLISVDLGMMYIDFSDRFREHCGRAIGIPASHVLVNCSHSHSSPATDGYMDYDTPRQMAMMADYTTLLLQRGAQTCSDATAAMQPARITTGWGECLGNINRRQTGPDGEMLLGEDPNGPCDHSVGVIRVDDLSGKPLAVAFRYSCHTVTLGPKTNVISPDFVGPARQIIEQNLGCLSLFLQGCAGNVNPASGIGQAIDNDPQFTDEKNRLGHQLGSEVLKVAQNLRSHCQRGEPRLVQSVAVYWWYPYERIEPGSPGNVRLQQTTMELPLETFPFLEEIRNEQAKWAARLAKARSENAGEWVINPLVRFNVWAQHRLETAQNGPNPVLVSFPIQTLEFGEFKIIALPFETMTETGLALRDTLGTDTFVLGYTNGMVSYLPTPQISQEGGMESKLAYKAYLLPAELPGTWEPQIKQQITQMIT